MAWHKRIGKLPVWKALILLLVIIMIFGFSIEIILDHYVFSLFDNFITRFEQVKKQDQVEWESLEKQREHWRQERKKMFQEQEARDKQIAKERNQKAWCNNYLSLKQEEKDLKEGRSDPLASTLYTIDEQKGQIAEKYKNIGSAISNGEFDLKKCQEANKIYFNKLEQSSDWEDSRKAYDQIDKEIKLLSTKLNKNRSEQERLCIKYKITNLRKKQLNLAYVKSNVTKIIEINREISKEEMGISNVIGNVGFDKTKCREISSS